MDLGPLNALGVPVPAPLPISWLGRSDAPAAAPAWATVGTFSGKQLNYLQAQIGYDQSRWDYTKIGANHQLGRYQFTAGFLESYGLLAQGSTAAYGIDAVNFNQCWQPTYINTGANAYQTYFYNATSQLSFLSTPIMQDHLAYQSMVDLYVALTNVNAIQSADSVDVAAGMIYVAWQLGVGGPPDNASSIGTGAWGWRYRNLGNGADFYNAGRYAITALTV